MMIYLCLMIMGGGKEDLKRGVTRFLWLLDVLQRYTYVRKDRGDSSS
jgi:hypothetical protein